MWPSKHKIKQNKTSSSILEMISRICGLFLKKLGWHNLNTHISHTTHHLHFHLFWCQCHILWFHRDNVITALWLLNWHLHWRAQNTHTSCTYPQCLPITSRMKVLWWLHNNRFWVRSSEISCLLCSHLKMRMPLGIPLCGGGDGIHDLYDAMQGRISADGHVSSTEVIVNGAHHANNIKVGSGLCLNCRDLTWGPKWQNTWQIG